MFSCERVIWLSLAVLAIGCSRAESDEPKAPAKPKEKKAVPSDAKAKESLPKTDAEWKKVLTPEQFRVTRQKGTEAPFTGEYYKVDKQGTYRCVCCGVELFSSDTKFDAHCGWPSFWDPIDKANIKYVPDNSHGMRRIEVQCANCGAHLGHVFNDGPKPTGQRYCINSASLKLKEKKKGEGETSAPHGATGPAKKP
jgi:peptide-methionine (R)-S-oxide reductase